jgi:EAL domain-containing protein (putative c-di-GMP-specific phosphodiesterase class I)
VAAEALVRWRGPNGKLIPPGVFIPLAEELGLIEQIGDWVLNEAGRQQRDWQDQGFELDVTINLSPRQFWQADLAEKVLAGLAANGASPSHVVVEITEATAAIDVERTQRILWSLNRHGIRVAIDDFGTGSSSLSRLKDLPVDVLKIDRSFVMDLPHQRGAASMVGAVIELAHGLGMVPLAEGIETAEQRRFLTQRGCTLGQGFVFSKPVTAREFTAKFGQRIRTDARDSGVVRRFGRAASNG